MKRLAILFFLLCLCLLPLKAQVSPELITIFNYSDFRNTQDLKLIHNARVIDKRVRLTQALESQNGGIWYTKEPLQVDRGFSTEFDFMISSPGGAGGGADGFALIIHNSHQNLEDGLSGGGIGYDGIPNCVAIEFDTFDNDELSNNHISVQTKGREPNKSTLDASIAINRLLWFNLKDSQIHHAKITYQTGKLLVYVDNMNKPKLTANIDIAKTIDLDNGKAWVGISAATGAGFANHDILNWSMQTTIPGQKQEETVVKKPEVVENRKVDYVKTFTVHSPDIIIRVWDNKEEDGDIISLNFNGFWVVQNFTLKKRAKDFKVNLNQKENFLVLHALNLGSRPPNTASVSIIEGKHKQTLVLSSDLQESQAISIVYEGK